MFAGRSEEIHWNGPQLVGAGGQSCRIGLIAFLGERDQRLIATARALHRDQRRACLLGKAAHDIVHGLSRCLGNLVPEILGRGVCVRMFLQVGIHALAKDLGPT